MRKFNQPYPKAFIKHIQGEIRNLEEEYDEEIFYIGMYLGELVLTESKHDEASYLVQLDNPNIGWGKDWDSECAINEDKTYWWVEPENLRIEFNNGLMETE